MEEQKLKKTLKGYLLGFISATLLVGCITAFAANTTTLYNVVANGIKIVVDGQKLNPTDVNGNKVEPIIYNGTTYLPVRAVANALGKAVYWDGPNYIVYLGDMDGKLEYPTLMLKNAKNIGNSQNWINELEGETLIDNYGNTYSNGLWICGRFGEKNIQTLLNGKYSRFKATLYVSQDYIINRPVSITIEADGYEIYSSPQFTKSSRPVDVDIDVTGYNDFKIICKTEYSESYNWGSQGLCIGNAGFYQ